MYSEYNASEFEALISRLCGYVLCILFIDLLLVPNDNSSVDNSERDSISLILRSFRMLFKPCSLCI